MAARVIVRCPECGSAEITGLPEEIADGVFHCSDCGYEFDYLTAGFEMVEDEELSADDD